MKINCLGTIDDVQFVFNNLSNMLPTNIYAKNVFTKDKRIRKRKHFEENTDLIKGV